MNQMLTDFYEREVIKQVYSGFSLTGNTKWNMWSDDFEGNESKQVCLPRLFYNKNLYKTPYYLDKARYFIHYTSIEALVEIVKYNRIRLNELNQVNDPLEVSFFENLSKIDYGNSFGLYLDGTDIEDSDKKSRSSRIKQNLYTFSLCNVDDVDNPDQFEMWRNYANEGTGVAIIFDIDNINRFDWYNFHLSKIYYGEDTVSEQLVKLIEPHKNFILSNSAIVNFFEDFISSFLATHKSKFYEGEKEVRLLTKHPDWTITDSIENDFIDVLDFNVFWNKDKSRSGVYLNLRNNYDYLNCKHLKAQNIPSIGINSVLLGYKNPQKTLDDLRGVVNNYNIQNEVPSFDIDFTKLKQSLGF